MEYVNLVLPPLLAFILSIQRVRNDYEIEDETGIIQFSFWSRYFLGYAIIYGAFAIFFYFLFTGQIDIPTDLGLQTTDTGNPKDGNTPNP